MKLFSGFILQANRIADSVPVHEHGSMHFMVYISLARGYIPTTHALKTYHSSPAIYFNNQ